MCGISGILNLNKEKIKDIKRHLDVCNKIQKHRGPDGENIWVHKDEKIGFGHVRLSIIDIENGQQPMLSSNNCIVFNGEIYNYLELQETLNNSYFKTNSDTEVILKAYERWGFDCTSYFRGMFSFALWDDKQEILFCARDFFGIKPFYYTIIDDIFYFASEIKSLLPFVKKIETDPESFKEYLNFQFVIGDKTLFKNIKQLEPGHFLYIKDGIIRIKKYWEVFYNLDFSHTEMYFEQELQEKLNESITLHTRSDVPIGGYLSGGLDSSIVCTLANAQTENFMAFTGRFAEGEKYDESRYAKIVSSHSNFDLKILDINHNNFIDNIAKIIYHMDQPTAGPGAFSQYMISQEASKYRKVLLGGQGGDEVFGGYTRYLIAYFEQCIKAAINDTLDSGNFIVTYESIIPNLVHLKGYQSLLKRFWKDGLFEDIDKRYFALINRSAFIGDEVRWPELEEYSTYDTFKKIFYGENVGKQSYFDLMTHFDFKTLLPALLHVEDRMSMAHGLESRVPLLDRPYIELAATIPSNIKFKNGNMKHIFKRSISKYIPNEISDRKDKMGFPTPFSLWANNELKDFMVDTLSCKSARERGLIDNKKVIDRMTKEDEFDRNLWAFLCLEIWNQEFHDKESGFKKLLE